MILELIERLAREAEKRGVEFLVIGGHAVVRPGEGLGRYFSTREKA
jgi:hypothetical protein